MKQAGRIAVLANNAGNASHRDSADFPKETWARLMGLTGFRDAMDTPEQWSCVKQAFGPDGGTPPQKRRAENIWRWPLVPRRVKRRFAGRATGKTHALAHCGIPVLAAMSGN